MRPALVPEPVVAVFSYSCSLEAEEGAFSREDLDVQDIPVQMGELLSRALSDCLRFQATLFFFTVS